MFDSKCSWKINSFRIQNQCSFIVTTKFIVTNLESTEKYKEKTNITPYSTTQPANIFVYFIPGFLHKCVHVHTCTCKCAYLCMFCKMNHSAHRTLLAAFFFTLYYSYVKIVECWMLSQCSRPQKTYTEMMLFYPEYVSVYS